MTEILNEAPLDVNKSVGVDAEACHRNCNPGVIA